jgi:hypothetical protein
MQIKNTEKAKRFHQYVQITVHVLRSCLAIRDQKTLSVEDVFGHFGGAAKKFCEVVD